MYVPKMDDQMKARFEDPKAKEQKFSANHFFKVLATFSVKANRVG